MEKTNIQHLRDIISELGEEMGTDPRGEKATEGEEFLEALDEEMTNYKDRISSLEEELAEKESHIRDIEDEDDMTERVDLGMDKLKWELENGNMVLHQEIKEFVSKLRLKYVGVPSV